MVLNMPKVSEALLFISCVEMKGTIVTIKLWVFFLLPNLQPLNVTGALRELFIWGINYVGQSYVHNLMKFMPKTLRNHFKIIVYTEDMTRLTLSSLVVGFTTNSALICFLWYLTYSTRWGLGYIWITTNFKKKKWDSSKQWHKNKPVLPLSGE